MGLESPSFFVYASVRTEVLQEVNRIGPESRRDVADYGSNISWEVKSDAQVQPILNIVSARINFSELESGEAESFDPWVDYFPDKVANTDLKQYLLDISMSRPRNLLQRLALAQSRSSNLKKFETSDFDESITEFSSNVWSEIEEDLLTTYSAAEVAGIKAIFLGYKVRFTLEELEIRIAKTLKNHTAIKKFYSREGVTSLLSVMYRIGAVGNQFSAGDRRSSQRDRWSYRGFPEPIFDKEFVIHVSLRKTLQL